MFNSLPERVTAVLFVAVLIYVASLFVEFNPTWNEDPREVSETVEEAVDQARNAEDLNVLFILVDTLRADRLGAYGYERATSPFLDRLASEGIRFSRHLSQSSWTKASMASLWTGLQPTRSGIKRFDDIVPEDAEMPAEILTDLGFKSVGLYRNGWVSPTFGFEQGFDVYTRPTPLPMAAKVQSENPTITAFATDESATAAAIEFLRVNRNEKWFLYLHLMDVHEYIYDEESAIFGSGYSDKYDSSILWTDRTLEIFFERLNAWGLTENTLVVLTSDHGEAFRERGYEGHARQVFKESTEVPWIISLPTRLKEGLVVNTRTQNVDVWRTIFDLLGVENESPQDGRSRVPDILAAGAGKTPTIADDEAAFAYLDQTWGQRSASPRPTIAVADGAFRYVRQASKTGQVESLFDSEMDADELIDVGAEFGDVLERLRSEADEYLALSPPWGDVPTRELNEMELNQLRALGYSIP